MKLDFRLLIPAAGIWLGAFLQSLFFDRAELIVLGFLLLISLLGQRLPIGIFLWACFVGALVLALHQSGLQKEFVDNRSGQVVRAEVALSSDVKKVVGKIRGDFRQQDRYMVEVQTREIDGTKISTSLLLVGGPELAELIPSTEIEILGRVRVFDGYSTLAGSLTQVGSVIIKKKATPLWQRTSEIRSQIKNSVNMLPADARALIPGLVIGDRSNQDQELTNAMRRSGLTHLTAVSGANFAIVAALLLAIGRALRIRASFLWLGIAISLTLFIFLVRPSSSVLRAAVMTGTLLFARSQGVRSSPIPALAAAISLLLLVNPFFVRDAGFALSVFATTGLLFLAPVIERRLIAYGVPRLLAEGLAIPSSATIFCLPFIVLLSGELSIISIMANFLVAPVIAVITALGLLLIILAPMSIPLATIVGWTITPFALWITFVAREFAALPFASLHWPQSWLGSLAVIALILTILLIIKSKRLRLKRIVLWLVVAILTCEIALTFRPFSSSWIPTDWSFFQCDVGQGDALIVRTSNNRAVVIDVGPEPDAIDRCLTLLGVHRIDLLILTHFHADHVSGLAGALSGRKVDLVWTSQTKEPAVEALDSAALLNGISHSSPSVNARFTSDSLVIQVVAAAALSSPNDSSISIIGNLRGMVFFAAGDLELEGQARALRALKDFRYRDIWDGRPIDLMKATHHGSALQDPRLVELLQPRTTFISVGVGNPYGHPTQSALELYGRFGTIYRTDTKRSLALAGRAGNLIVVAQPVSPWAL